MAALHGQVPGTLPPFAPSFEHKAAELHHQLRLLLFVCQLSHLEFESFEAGGETGAQRSRRTDDD